MSDASTEEPRDSMLVYRSFYEAIREIPKENQAEVWEAIFELGFNFNEINLQGLSKTIFTLVKPIIEANIKRYQNGSKDKRDKSETEAKVKRNRSKSEAKQKQTVSKTEANKDKDKDDEEDVEISPSSEGGPDNPMVDEKKLVTTSKHRAVAFYQGQLSSLKKFSDAGIVAAAATIEKFNGRGTHYKLLAEYMVNGHDIDCPGGMGTTVLQLRDQITFLQYSSLIDSIPCTPAEIKEVVLAMHNDYNRKVKGKTTLAGTARNWLKIRRDNPRNGHHQEGQKSAGLPAPQTGRYQ